MSSVSAGFIPPGKAPCSKCGVAIDPATANLSNEGTPVCMGCFTATDIDRKLANGARIAATGVLVSGILSFTCVNFLYLFTIFGAIAAVRAFQVLTRGDVQKAAGGWHAVYMTIAIIGSCMLLLRVVIIPFELLGLTMRGLGIR